MHKVAKSHSGLEQFLFCERQLFYQRVAKVPLPPNMYFAVGNLYHDALAEMVRPGVGVKTSPGIIALNILLAKHKKKSGWLCPTSDKDLTAELKANLARVQKEVAPLVAKHVEVWGNDINPDSEFCAKIDVVSANTPIVDDYGHITGAKEGACVIDWKTIFGRRRRSVAEACESQQLALYCLEAKVNTAAFFEVPRDLTRPTQVLLAEFTDEELEQWRRYLRVQFEVMQRRGPLEADYRLADFNNPLCSKKWCGYWDRCLGGGKK
jgi:hypothetical protein